jgi:palmitoyltransferase
MTAASRRVAFAKGTAIGLPVFLLAILIYCCFVFVGVVVDQYLIRDRGRFGAAAVILVFFSLLLLLSLASYLRILQTRWVDSDYTPRGPWKPDPNLLKSENSNTRSGCIPSPSTEKPGETSSGDLRIAFQINPRYIVRGIEMPPAGLDKFYSKDVFVCDSWGLPLWCNYCAQYKNDRCHHFSDVGRCSRRGDHFCVW